MADKAPIYPVLSVKIGKNRRHYTCSQKYVPIESFLWQIFHHLLNDFISVGKLSEKIRARYIEQNETDPDH